CLHLLQRELRRIRIISLRHYATGGTNLYDIGPIFDDFPYLVLYRLDPVRCSLAGIVIFKRQQIVITVSPGDAESRPADQHPRPGNVARIDRVPQSYVAETTRPHIAHGSEAGFQ